MPTRSYITEALKMRRCVEQDLVEVYAPNGRIVFTQELPVNPANQDYPLESIIEWVVEFHSEDIEEEMTKLGYVCVGDWI